MGEQAAQFSDPPIDGWAVSQGPVRWYVYDLATDEVLDSHTPAIADLVRCEPDEPRKVRSTRSSLVEARMAVERYIKNSYLRQSQAPVWHLLRRVRTQATARHCAATNSRSPRYQEACNGESV